MDVLCYRVPEWQAQNGLLHGFVGRQGGRSQEPYATLNVSFRVGDQPESVMRNIAELKEAVGVRERIIVTMQQEHGDGIIDVMEPKEEAGSADGMATPVRGVLLGVLSADCTPMLFFAVQGSRKTAAVVHAGWRGTLKGLGAKMIRHLRTAYGVEPGSVQCALGPTIGSCCYEIRSDVAAPLSAKFGAAAGCLERRGGSLFLDLKELNRRLLEEAGVPAEQIFSVGPCTACSPAEFFSHRRAQRADSTQTGRQLSFIGWG